ncbi:putative molybdenum carrier protein [Mangrovibacterium diazotrophicum]|uniref:Putative molybdenum carrier protein n=1 Tax=Mangrovibacterium diazotrophicum TaxID=1261403 RepID=A0A419W7W2_9BACT|nr:putative molybdenum carrier protein [Mangrovibacterium diazotrophicum]RKD91546.1 putative molybdenum carrier protein [Mangrovibacterium diazotrophicum]
MGLQIIISGGQTGVDRGALDACLELEFPCGGWCPAGRAAEDGPIPHRYPMIELRSPYYDDRTRRNIVESDATLIISNGKLSGGTLLTANFAKHIGKPVFTFELSPFFIDRTMEDLVDFLEAFQVETLNVAGPRGSQWDKARETTCHIIKQLIRQLYP